MARTRRQGARGSPIEGGGGDSKKEARQREEGVARRHRRGGPRQWNAGRPKGLHLGKRRGRGAWRVPLEAGGGGTGTEWSEAGGEAGKAKKVKNGAEEEWTGRREGRRKGNG